MRQTRTVPAIAHREAALPHGSQQAEQAIEWLNAGLPIKALPILRKVAKRAPVYANLLNLAAALRGVGDFDAAREALQACVQQNPAKPEAWNNLAQLATDQGKFAESCALFQACLERVEAQGLEMSTPGVQNIILGFAHSLMRFQEFTRAWPLWEYGRLNVSWHPLPGTKRWTGERVESLLVICEGGFGDAFLFSRWLPLAAERVDHLSLMIWDQLVDWTDWHKLGVTGDVVRPNIKLDSKAVQARGVLRLSHELMPEYFDATTSWMSLPAICGMKSLADIPPIPVDFGPTHTKAESAAPRIGFCWHAEENGTMRRTKKLDLYSAQTVADCLTDLGTVHSLVPMKAGLHLSETPKLPKRVAFDAENLASWKATTEFMRTLDAVVTVDTAVAHLAGVLGIPCLVLIPLRSAWFFFTDTDSGPWYPKMKYYRSKLPSWQPGEICAAVKQFAAEMA